MKSQRVIPTRILWSTPSELLPNPILDALSDLHWEPLLIEKVEPDSPVKCDAKATTGAGTKKGGA